MHADELWTKSNCFLFSSRYELNVVDEKFNLQVLWFVIFSECIIIMHIIPSLVWESEEWQQESHKTARGENEFEDEQDVNALDIDIYA